MNCVKFMMPYQLKYVLYKLYDAMYEYHYVLYKLSDVMYQDHYVLYKHQENTPI